MASSTQEPPGKGPLTIRNLCDLLGLTCELTTAVSPAARIIAERPTGFGHVETLSLAIQDEDVPATLIRPAGPGPFPAVLYCHAHGNRYSIGRSELELGRPALREPAYGPRLAESGIASLCLDMPGFGARQIMGTESSLAKAQLWKGRPLIGVMLAEQIAGITYLCGRPDIRPDRIAGLGISMGATLAYFLAALDGRIRAVAHLCAFANMAPLIASGAHDLHGPYMIVPGLLKQGDLAGVAALVAPRPQLICAGLKDPLTPPDALMPALRTVERAYRDYPANLQVVVDKTAGHEETPGMRTAVEAFLTQNLTDPHSNETMLGS